MKTCKMHGWVVGQWVCLALVALCCQPSASKAAGEDTLDVLQIGTTTYHNVTVTTKNKNYIFILHSRGMTNVKVADLPPDVQTKLGYVDPLAQAKTNSSSAWAKQTLARIETPQVKQMQAQLLETLRRGSARASLNLPPISSTFLWIIVGALAALYLFHCYCCMLICAKTGSEPGVLVWLPLLQLFPLLKAASMSPWWFVAFLVPGLNLVAQVLWCLKITAARGKTFLVAILLIFPLTSWFAALYLAFSGSRRARRENRRVEIMTLETV